MKKKFDMTRFIISIFCGSVLIFISTAFFAVGYMPSSTPTSIIGLITLLLGAFVFLYLGLLCYHFSFKELLEKD